MGESAADRRLTRWARRHDGIEASAPVRLWLRLMWSLAGPLRRVPPTAITVLSVIAAVAAVPVAPRRRAAGLLLASAVFDGLDGAVAIVGESSTSAGARADAIADRIADCAWAAVLGRCGAPRSLVVAAAGSSTAFELTRRRPTRVTVGERPTRLICALVALGSGRGRAAGLTWLGLTAAAFGQLNRRR